MCRDDVIGYALNHLRPYYASQQKGEIITSVAIEDRQERTNVAIALLEGFERVKTTPRPEHP